MKRFISGVFQTITGISIMLFGMLALVAFIGWIAVQADTAEVKSDTVLKFKLGGELSEMASETPFDELPEPLGTGGAASWSLLDLLPALERATKDERIKGMYIEAGSFAAGFANMSELRERLIQFKEAGKFIYAYGEIISEGNYYLMSVADSIILHPEGGMDLNGIGGEVMFYRGMFDKVGIKPEIFRVGNFKSAVEPYLRQDMSEDSRYQMEVYLNALYDTYLTDISESRGMSKEVLTEISNKMLVRSPEDALERGLITQVGYEDELKDAIKRALGLEDDGKVNYLSLKKYTSAKKIELAEEEEDITDRVAVIIGEGTIVYGKGKKGEIGGEWVAEQIRKARKSKSVKAIVLRINSPGGSALASDMMWREVMLTKGVKPIIASMSDVAASGGYYMAMACDTIVARPNTITGSIGIFSVYFSAEELLKNKMGLNFEEVTTGEFSNIGSPSEGFTEAERAILQAQIEEGYESFTSKAAAGRGLSLDSLKTLASGRVWIGTDAYDRGLVDVLGGFEDAVRIAASHAGLEEGSYKKAFYHKKAEGLAEMIGQARVQWQDSQRKEVMGELYPLYQDLQQLKNLQGKQMLWEEKVKW